MPSKTQTARAWQRMLSGRRLDLLDPSPFDIEIEDIAHGLARVARWNGQTKGAHAFSVAQHCLLVERVVSELLPRADRSVKLMALLHDAPEYVVGDLISPFKAAVGLDYKDFELRLLSAIHLRFGLPAKTPADTREINKEGGSYCRIFRSDPACGVRTRGSAEIFRRAARNSAHTAASTRGRRRGPDAVSEPFPEARSLSFLQT